MQTEKISLDETGCFSTLFLDYLAEKPELKSFYDSFPSVSEFKGTIAKRNFDKAKRKVLVDVLKRQYEEIDTIKQVSENIERLSNENTFTITTGHQLNIFTGPLYFIYKIVTVINTCKVLKNEYPDYDFVPVYWMASEDHDFDEINHFFLDGKKFQWDTDQKGAVGRFNPNGLNELAHQLPGSIEFFKEAYSADNLADAVRNYVNHLFAEEGIIVVDADSAELKAEFAEVITDDLFNHSAKQASDKDTKELQSLGYKTQVSAREINFFYLDDGVRERIEKAENGFNVLETDVSFSDEEIKELIQSNPEKFSPNVILRPLYQETILPNLAYIGGPSEVVYWLQLKSVFEHFNTPFPLLMPRNFALIIPDHVSQKWAKTGLTDVDLFLDKDSVFGKWVKQNSNAELSYQTEIEKLNAVFEELNDKAGKVDPTLTQHLGALKASATKDLEKAEKKLLRAEKRKHTDKESQIGEVIEALFPGGSLQERKENFLNFYLNDSSFIKTLLECFDPFEFKMYLLKK